LFKTHQLQKQICKEYVNHDPTKGKSGCVEVLLCRPNIKGYENKWVAISTIRKLKPECMLERPQTYADVPKEVMNNAIKHLKAAPEWQKDTMKKVLKLFVDKLKKDPEFRRKMIKKSLKDKPILVKDKRDFIKKLFLKKIKEHDKKEN
jgi:hypothetical protein